MFILYSDFGLEGPYTGQVKAKLIESAPEVPIVDLMADAPRQNPQAAAYLLAAYALGFPADSIFICVIDPGVGSDRPGVIVKANDHWFVGPSNGLFELILRRAESDSKIWEIDWQPDTVSATFHGRDIFAPVSGILANGSPIPGIERPIDWERQNEWPDELAEVIYIDNYGNAITGLRASFVKPSYAIEINSVYLENAVTYSSVPSGQAFWYVNSNGLIEIAINKGNASKHLNLNIGTKIGVSDGAHSSN